MQLLMFFRICYLYKASARPELVLRWDENYHTNFRACNVQYSSGHDICYGLHLQVTLDTLVCVS